MGQDHPSSPKNNNLCNPTPLTYLSKQLACWRWRADPHHNRHIPRVTFQNSTTRQAQQHLQTLLNQKQRQSYPLTTQDIANLAQQLSRSTPQQYIIFEEYACKLEDMSCELNLGQCLMVLEELLLGYEEILGWLGECMVDVGCCFVTAKGEVRVWINPNHRCNQVREEDIKLIREHSVVKAILEAVKTLYRTEEEYVLFMRQLKVARQPNIIERGTFSWTRQFLHNYAYHHNVTIPLTLTLPSHSLTQSPINISLHSSQSTTRIQLCPPQVEALKHSNTHNSNKPRSHYSHSQGRSFNHPAPPHPISQQPLKEPLPTAPPKNSPSPQVISLPNRRYTAQQLGAPCPPRRKAASITTMTGPQITTMASTEPNRTSILNHKKSQFFKNFERQEDRAFLGGMDCCQSRTSSEFDKNSRQCLVAAPSIKCKKPLKGPVRHGHSLLVGRGQTCRAIWGKQNGIQSIRRQTSGDFHEIMGRTISNLLDDSIVQQQVSKGSLQSVVESAYDGTLSYMARSATMVQTSAKFLYRDQPTK